MSDVGLTSRELSLVHSVLMRHPEVVEARVFGSRARGDSSATSDFDIALWGDVSLVQWARIAGELDQLPLPYQFDVVIFDNIRHDGLRRDIAAHSVVFYRKPVSGAGTG
ncbi:MAG: nucleotidyltransferase domain-containing protein [Candidatus Sumerlaeaceae bacterium]|nr:nucleotidyltransferase domain-containing protein [Candidatus Sumerlaeaceae bacterium]